MTEAKVPVSIKYMDEDGSLARTMTWEEPKTIDGRNLPHVMRLVPADSPDEFTVVRYQDIAFDVSLPESTFTLQALKQTP